MDCWVVIGRLAGGLMQVLSGKATACTRGMRNVDESRIFSLECTNRTIDLQVRPFPP